MLDGLHIRQCTFTCPTRAQSPATGGWDRACPWVAVDRVIPVFGCLFAGGLD